MTWLLTVLSLTGVILNVKKRRAGFFFWFPANIGWAIISFRAHLPALGILWVVYAGLAVWGLWEWRADPVAKQLDREMRAAVEALEAIRGGKDD